MLAGVKVTHSCKEQKAIGISISELVISEAHV